MKYALEGNKTKDRESIHSFIHSFIQQVFVKHLLMPGTSSLCDPCRSGLPESCPSGVCVRDSVGPPGHYYSSPGEPL